jgi:signal transduction histidine kinase/methyl-accepting chemotaxis protein
MKLRWGIWPGVRWTPIVRADYMIRKIILVIRNSLAVKTILVACSILFVILGFITITSVVYNSESMIEQEKKAASRIARTIMAAIRNPMLNGDQDEIQKQFQYFARDLSSNEFAHLVDHKKIIRRSTDKRLIGQQTIARNIDEVLAGRELVGVESRVRTKKQVFASTTPIFNEKKCYVCHGPDLKVLGVLRVALDWDHVNQSLAKNRNRNILFSLIGLGLMSSLLVLLLYKIVIWPVIRLQMAMRRVSKGDFSELPKVDIEDEIGELTRRFNDMAGDLQSLLDQIRGQADFELKKSEELAKLNIELRNEIEERQKIETAMRNSEQQIRAAHAQLEQIIEFLPDATFVIDKDKKVIAWNRAIEEMTGVKKADIIGQGDHAYAVPFYGERRPILTDFIFDYDKDAAATYQTLIKRGSTYVAETFVPRLFSGKGAFVWAVTAPLFDGSSTLIGAVESVRDITERKKNEEALHDAYLKLQQTQNELTQSSKMVAMGQLAAGVSHELNQPLTGIRGYLQTMMLDLEKDSPFLADFKKVIEQTERMDVIIRNIRLFARKSVFLLEEIDIHKPIADALALMNEQLKLQNITVDLKLEPGLDTIQADHNQLQQVFINLLTNARDAIMTLGNPDGGTITIKSSRSADGKGIEIFFEDNGCGIPPENIDSIFNPFFTTKSPDGGIGLGLSIVYRIVESHGGSIRVESFPSQGTSFIINLPVKKTEEMKNGAASV